MVGEARGGTSQRRLAIAGSAVAPGDFRLKKLVQPLEKSGEKAPVFARVGQAVQAVGMILKDGVARAMERFNRRVSPPQEPDGKV